MWRSIDAGERRSRRQFAETGLHTLLCNRHAYLRLLARDLRCAPAFSRRSGWKRPGSPLRLPLGGRRRCAYRNR
jgi:hypothetical protein